jgi:hypothetical protein
MARAHSKKLCREDMVLGRVDRARFSFTSHMEVCLVVNFIEFLRVPFEISQNENRSY